VQVWKQGVGYMSSEFISYFDRRSTDGKAGV
jgi:hypothetical protein